MIRRTLSLVALVYAYLSRPVREQSAEETELLGATAH